MKTRSRKLPGKFESTPTTTKGMEEQTQDPLRLLILPEGMSRNARICTLSHPRTSTPCRYYWCPENGLYEFKKFAAPKSARQSWLLGRQYREANPGALDPEPSRGENPAPPEVSSKAEEEASRPVSDGYIISTPELLIATPIDPLFLALPALHVKALARSPSSKGLFLSADDILEPLEEGSRYFKEICTHDRTRQSIKSRMKVICDTVEAGDDTMFRLNVKKLLAELVMKASKMVQLGLPASMEAKFISRALERPVMALKREESTFSETTQASTGGLLDAGSTPTEKVDSQSSTTTSLSAEDSGVSIGTEVTFSSQENGDDSRTHHHHLLRLRVALSYILSAYVPQPLVVELNAILASAESPFNFSPLDEELAVLAKMRSEALASRSLSDFSRKRGIENDEAAEIKAEKKAKKEEEERKKKAGDTRGIRDLRKVDTSGMKKMSDFFGKAPAAKKKN